MVNFNENSYYKLFASCIPVKGARRSIIYDLQRESYLFIPNILFEILTLYKNHSVKEIKNIYHNKNDDNIDKYFKHLIQNEYIFLCNRKDELERFPDLDLRWDSPHFINSSIVDTDQNSNHDFQQIFNQLEKLACKFIQLRFFSPISCVEIEQIMHFLEDTAIISIELVLPLHKIEINEFWATISKYPRIIRVFLYGAEMVKLMPKPKGQISDIILVKNNIIGEDSCGNVCNKFFAFNISTFTESLEFNSCLNRKVSIDRNGEIKNCPSMKNSFGNIKNTLLQGAIDNPDFKELWTITKDEIETCKDCEFRYACIDCRVFIKDKKNIYSKPEKCPYDPYSTKGF